MHMVLCCEFVVGFGGLGLLIVISMLFGLQVLGWPTFRFVAAGGFGGFLVGF